MCLASPVSVASVVVIVVNILQSQSLRAVKTAKQKAELAGPGGFLTLSCDGPKCHLSLSSQS